ncbi:MAG: hypothetical protein AAGD38_10110, partial [Acidobacteriota bacterium]
MSNRTLIILAMIVVGLATFILFVERDLLSTEERIDQARKVMTIDADEVERFAWAASDGPITLVRQRVDESETGTGETDMAGMDMAETNTTEPDRWFVDVVDGPPADATVVAGLLGRVLDHEKTRTIEDQPRDQAGLEPPTQSKTIDV